MITIRVVELARALQVHRNTVRNWIKSGVLEAQPTVGKKYLVSEAAFIGFIQSQGIAIQTVSKWLDSAPADAPVSQSNKQPERRKEERMAKQPIGSVLVVGGGITGIQATLDLADSGYYVYLMEKSPGIGGVMAKLDKTFPTNDCAM